MTIIVVRDNIMAADGLVASAGTRWAKTKKIKRLSNGALLGIAGDSIQAVSFAIVLERAVKAGAQPIMEMVEPYDDIACLYLCSEGVYAMASDKNRRAGILKLEGEFFAEGSGLDAALGALHMGANATRAAEIACAVCHNCEGPVQTEAL